MSDYFFDSLLKSLCKKSYIAAKIFNTESFNMNTCEICWDSKLNFKEDYITAVFPYMSKCPFGGLSKLRARHDKVCGKCASDFDKHYEAWRQERVKAAYETREQLKAIRREELLKEFRREFGDVELVPKNKLPLE